MRTFSKFLLCGGCAAILTGTALAAADRVHVMDVALPDGTVAQVRYVGDVQPKVVVGPAVAMADADPFAMFDRISLAMDRQMDTMLRQVSALAAAPAAGGQLSQAALQSLPAGTVSYSYTSYSSGNGATCSQSVRVTALHANEAPKVERQSAGDCTAMNSRQATPTVQRVLPSPGSATPAVQRTTPDAQPKLTPASLEKARTPAAKGPVI